VLASSQIVETVSLADSTRRGNDSKMPIRAGSSAKDCVASNLRGGVLFGVAAGVIQFSAFKIGGAYLIDPALSQLRSLIQITAINALLFGAAGLVIGIVGGGLLGGRRASWAQALASTRPAAVYTFAPAAIPTMWFLAWFNFSFRRARDPLCVALNVAFLLAFLVGAFVLHWSRWRRSPSSARSRAGSSSLAGALALAAAAAFVFFGARASFFGILSPDIEPAELRTSLPDSLLQSAHASFADKQFNIVLLSIDALRADHLGCYGYPRGCSPTLDSLAASGVIFRNAVAQYPMTSPNFATMFTGTYPAIHGIKRVQTILDDRNVTLAEVLRAAGYNTCGVITNGNLYPVFNFSQGFDDYRTCGHKQPEKVTSTAVEWISSSPREPFFLWMHYTEPHGPYNPIPPYDTMYDPAENPRSATMTDEAGEERVARAIARYDGSIRRTDDSIRRFMAELRRSGYADHTLLLVTSDHGESFGEHGYYFGHGAYAYEPTVRVVLIMSYPGVLPAGRSVAAPVATVDFMPTLLNAVGLPLGDRIQGHSFLPTALGLTDESPGEFVFIQAGVIEHGAMGFVSAIRSERYKYIRRHREWGQFPSNPVKWLLSLTSIFEGGLSADELYAIQDAREVDNLVRRDRETAARLRAKVDAFLAYLGQWETPEATQLIDKSQLDEETYEALKSLGYIR